MGQLFNRIRRIVESERHTPAAGMPAADIDAILGQDDDELRRLIDALGTSTNTSASTPPPSPDASSDESRDVPPDVVQALEMLHVAHTEWNTVTPDAIHAAYLRQMALWHPDRFASAAAADQQQAQRRAQDVNAAYIVLKAYYG